MREARDATPAERAEHRALVATLCEDVAGEPPAMACGALAHTLALVLSDTLETADDREVAIAKTASVIREVWARAHGAAGNGKG